MNEQNPDTKTRLEVNDKRYLFQSLLAMAERLFYLNKFPVDMVDFALSVLSADEEKALRLIRERSKATINWSSRFDFEVDGFTFFLHMYADGEGRMMYQHQTQIFPQLDNWLSNKYAAKVSKWAQKQIRLEDQLLRTAKVLKAIVHSCNTVGQYKRVSPELVTFLPDKYRLALADYVKTSPYPAITVEPEEINDAINTLAFAALQPQHRAETDYSVRPKYGYGARHYDLGMFPRSTTYHMKKVRQLEL